MPDPSAELITWLRVVAADARRRLAAGTVPPHWVHTHLPEIDRGYAPGRADAPVDGADLSDGIEYVMRLVPGSLGWRFDAAPGLVQAAEGRPIRLSRLSAGT
jgi:hypothetical protein